jgi:hypothetical protein
MTIPIKDKISDDAFRRFWEYDDETLPSEAEPFALRSWQEMRIRFYNLARYVFVRGMEAQNGGVLPDEKEISKAWLKFKDSM